MAVEHYLEHRDRIGAGTAESTKYNLAECREYVRYVTEIEMAGENEVMNSRRFCEWVTDNIGIRLNECCIM